MESTIYRRQDRPHANISKHHGLEPTVRIAKNRYRELLEEYREELSALQSVLYAHNRHAVLLIFQGMDTAGKDGAIRHVMSGVNPQGCQVFSFKQPSSEELQEVQRLLVNEDKK